METDLERIKGEQQIEWTTRGGGGFNSAHNGPNDNKTLKVIDLSAPSPFLLL